jgi:hypothetical protein
MPPPFEDGGSASVASQSGAAVWSARRPHRKAAPAAAEQHIEEAINEAHRQQGDRRPTEPQACLQHRGEPSSGPGAVSAQPVPDGNSRMKMGFGRQKHGT